MPCRCYPPKWRQGLILLDYQVTDSSNPQGAEDADFTVTVLASRPTPLALPDIPDQTFKRSTLPQTVTLPAASGGAGSYSYLISSADEGVDVLLNGNTRVLTVRDMAPGTYAINYTAVDADDSRLVKGFIITIQEDLTLPQPDNITIHVGDVGGVDLPLATGATSNVRYAVTGLPTGLSFVALGSRNRIQWIAGTTAGTHTLTYTATDGSASASRTFTLTIRAAAVVVPVEGEGPYVDPPPGVHSNLDTDPAGTEGTGSGDDDLTTGCEMGVTPSVVGNPAGISIADGKIVVGDDAACGENSITIKCGEDVAAKPGTPWSPTNGCYLQFPGGSSGAVRQYFSSGTAARTALFALNATDSTNASRNSAWQALVRRSISAGNTPLVVSYRVTTTDRRTFARVDLGLSSRRVSSSTCPVGGSVGGGARPCPSCTGPTPGRTAPTHTKTFRKACPVECPGQTEFELDQCELWEMANNNEEIFNIPTPETRDGSGVTTTITGLPDGLTEIDGSFGLAPTNFQAFMAFMVQNGRRVTFTMQYTTDSGETTECPIVLSMPEKACSDSFPCIEGDTREQCRVIGRPPVPVPPEGTRPSHDLDIQGRDLLGVLGCGNVHIPLPVANGGSGNYTYTLYDLPTGVLYDNELHALVGSADEPLEVLITMRAFDGTGAVTDEQMTLRFVERANADNPLFTVVQYNQSNIQEIVDRTLALKIDISHMRIYKQEATVKVFFDDARLGRQIILDTTGIERGKFSILKEGTRTYIFIAPEVIRSMYNQLQTQAAGCWYIEIRSSLEPLKHRADFGSTDITERALEEEFKRLDIQDQTKIVERSAVPPEPAENSVESPHIKPDSVLTNHLNDGVVEQKAIRAGSVTEDKLRDGAVTTPKVKNLAVSANKIEQNVVDTKHIKDNAVTQAKLADPTKLLASPVQTEDKIDEYAVTTAKLKDGAVDTRNLGGGAVTTSKIKDRSVTADKVAQASLTTGNVKDGSFFRPLADREVNTENIVNKQVGRRELDYRNLYKYMQNEMAIFDLPVLNPEQIGVGQPCGFHVLPGDTKPTAFPLEGFYEYVPEEVEQDRVT